jgi:hypothetical protein
MKAIDKMKNMMIQEFQHSPQSPLIQVMTFEMPSIQFEPIVTAIQTRETEFLCAFRKMVLSIP